MRHFFQGFVAIAACLSIAGAADAARADDDYPNRPVRFLVGYPPAGTVDICARLIGQYLSEHLHQQFAIENKPGAGNNLATEIAAHSPPDGYTIFLANPANAINATLYKNLSFNFIQDMAPVAGIVRTPNIMEVNPNVPAKTVAEFISYAKANPGKIDLGTAGNGSPPHMFAELFMAMTGVKFNVVGYRGGGPALIDLIGGHVQAMFEGITSSIGYLRAGKLRPLGVTSAKRSAALPDVPPIADAVPGYDAAGWFGLGAPKGTPAPVIDTLSKAVAAALADPAMQAKLANLGAEPMPMGPDEFGKLIAGDTEKWGKVIRAADIKMD
jgi:tripartite-type tricarboxylate transporter receptor subunit TctC